MKITFIMPCVGKKSAKHAYVKTWQMEPLAIAVLSSLTPKSIDKVFYDDRLETIPYQEATDLVAISVETYTARRAYQIATKYRKKGVPVVLGGYHVTLMSEEAEKYGDTIVIGEAENIWGELLNDFQQNKLKKKYQSKVISNIQDLRPDRSIYGGKKYSDLVLIETARGCPFSCEFCSISSFFKQAYNTRPIKDVVNEIKQLKSKKIIFFIDDNIAVDFNRTRELFNEIKKLKIKWVGQVSINIAQDENLVKLMSESGCLGVLIGFESINARNLELMGKDVNNQTKNYDQALAIFRKNNLIIYATFLFGYAFDTEETFKKTYDFIQKNHFFFAAFNHLVPFPGTPLYSRLKKENKLLYSSWWLEKNYKFGDLSFKPENFAPEIISTLCFKYRKKMYSLLSIIKRGIAYQNRRTLLLIIAFFVSNFLNRGDVKKRQGLPLGVAE